VCTLSLGQLPHPTFHAPSPPALQDYSIRKVLERQVKSVTHDRGSISVAPPKWYGRRFLDFVTARVFAPAGGPVGSGGGGAAGAGPSSGSAAAAPFGSPLAASAGSRSVFGGGAAPAGLAGGGVSLPGRRSSAEEVEQALAHPLPPAAAAAAAAAAASFFEAAEREEAAAAAAAGAAAAAAATAAADGSSSGARAGPARKPADAVNGRSRRASLEAAEEPMAHPLLLEQPGDQQQQPPPPEQQQGRLAHAGSLQEQEQRAPATHVSRGAAGGTKQAAPAAAALIASIPSDGDSPTTIAAVTLQQ
jgi:hypothetical protein